jgi:hypothetical protein
MYDSCFVIFLTSVRQLTPLEVGRLMYLAMALYA